MNRGTVSHVLQILGYEKENIAENYFVQIDGTSAVKYDVVAFSGKYLKDISTSCIAVQNVTDEHEEGRYIDGAKYLAVPVLIISMNDRMRVWKIKADGSVLLKDDKSNMIQLYFERNRFEFMSDSLMASKMRYRQIDFCEAAGLIDFSREATCNMLSEEFEKGFLAAKAYLISKKKINGQDLNNITSITMHVIAALIINSKVSAVEKLADIRMLIDRLSQRYQEYFDAEIMNRYGEELPSIIFNSLTHSINYQSVDHELLGYFYESTLLQISKVKAGNIRKKFGIYYTPRVLSQQMSRHIPFEMVPPDDRYVLDGTCGSGSLLLSACKRLENLVRLERTDYDRQKYLADMIQGYDVDKFASEVAKLSLLLYSLPAGVRWNIKAGDLLRMDHTKIRTPYIILGNPPYGEKRGDSKREQKAAAFLEKYMELLHEDGYLGIVLPESFMQNDCVKQQREKLLSRFDLLEFWMLPGQIFENNCSTIVLIARKKHAEKDNITKIRILTRNKYSIKRFLSYGNWDFEFLSNIQSKWIKEKEMKISPIEKILQKITKNNKKIEECLAGSGMGIMLPPDIELSKMQFDGWVPYLKNAKNFRKYVISEEMSEEIRFVNYAMTNEQQKNIKRNFKGFRLRKNFEQLYSSKTKVLVKMSSTPGEIDCIRAFVDEDRIYPEHSFFCMTAKDEQISDYILCALVNSKIINAYIRRECVKRTITTKTVRSIPVPEFSEEQKKKIEVYYFQIKEAYLFGDDEEILALQDRLDDIIYDAFGLSSDEKDQVNRVFTIYRGMDTHPENKNRSEQKYYNVTGEVINIMTNQMVCKVFLAELGELEIKLSDSMPGWFLREKAEFSAKLCNGNLFDIKPLLFSDLDDDDIYNMLKADMI